MVCCTLLPALMIETDIWWCVFVLFEWTSVVNGCQDDIGEAQDTTWGCWRMVSVFVPFLCLIPVGCVCIHWPCPDISISWESKLVCLITYYYGIRSFSCHKHAFFSSFWTYIFFIYLSKFANLKDIFSKGWHTGSDVWVKQVSMAAAMWLKHPYIFMSFHIFLLLNL